MTEKYALVVCSLGTNSNLQLCLKSLLNVKENSDEEIEIILVLNTVENSLIFDPRIQIVLEPIKGYAQVRNTAVAHLEAGSSLIFLDDDEIASLEWFNSLVTTHKQFPDDIVVGPVFSTNSTDAHSYRGQFDIFYSRLNNNSTIKKAPTANMLIPESQLCRGIVKFDEFYNFSGGEDTDLCFRLGKLGVKIRYAKGAILYEKESDERFSTKYIEARFIKETVNYSVILKRNSEYREMFFRFLTLLIRIFAFSFFSFFAKNLTFKRTSYVKSFLALFNGKLYSPKLDHHL